MVTDNPGWKTRFNHSAVVFDDKMWIFGGRTDGESAIYSNDVWYSSDGINWTLAAAAAPWEKRSSFASVVFDNKMWVIGGYEASVNGGLINSTLFSDVWYSSDGISWTLATDTASWGKRLDHTSVVFDNKMWVIGGRVDTTGRTNDVWSSTDGVAWIEETSFAEWSKRSSHTSVVFNNKMWVLGGNTIGKFYNDVWYSQITVDINGNKSLLSTIPILNGCQYEIVNNDLKITLFDNSDDGVVVHLLSINGRVLKSIFLSDASCHTISMQGYSKGMYILQFVANGITETRKVLYN